MRLNILKILARQVWATTFKSTSTRVLMGLVGVLLIFALQTGYKNVSYQNAMRNEYRKSVRENWENSPDKHPHRMAHYGYIAFRNKHPLSFFDFGMENYVGNAVFLEAHRQNTVNLSEASFSTGILRFGEISAAMILQVLLPLLIFFWGFNVVATDRENGTLKILLSQGVSWSELIVGKTLGVFSVASVVFLTAILATAALIFPKNGPLSIFAVLSLFYAIYLFICCFLAVLVSARCQNAKSALTQLIGCWLLFTIVLPRMSQAVGQFLHPAPSKVAFDTAIEAETLAKGDSHNPNDPYFKAFKDSVLRVNRVDSVQQLSFNYSGLQMKEGERMTAEIYVKNQQKLLKTYQNQQNVGRFMAFMNPFMAIKNVSMALTGTDFAAYTDFQNQAEAYRYRLAQQMNDWQIQYISNKKQGETDKPYYMNRDFWQQFPDFEYKNLEASAVFRNEIASIGALLCWFFGLFIWLIFLSKRLKAI